MDQAERGAARAAGGAFAGALPLIGVLIAVYAVSQFYRNSVGVIASDLARELDLTATQIGLLSSGFFLAFAAAQVPVGIAIDRYGPKRTMLASGVVAVAGGLLFAQAPSAQALIAGRLLLGLGCSTFFMGPLALYARRFPPQRFALLTSIQLGLASVGTLFATAPLAVAASAFGWRSAFLGVAALTAGAVLLIALMVPREAVRAGPRESWGEALSGVGQAMRARSFWPVFLIHFTSYAAFATVIGLWAGPWLTDVYGADLDLRGRILLVGAAAQIGGLFAWGAADSLLKSYRRACLIGGSTAALLLAVAALVPLPLWAAVLWLALFGFAVAYTPIVTAHGKALFPPALTGRGITLMNIGTMGGAFMFQTATGALVDLFGRGTAGYPPAAYQAVFALLAVGLLLSLTVYSRAVDPHPSRSHAKLTEK